MEKFINYNSNNILNSDRKYILVILVILLSKSLYFESYGENKLLIFLLIYISYLHFIKREFIRFRKLIFIFTLFLLVLPLLNKQFIFDSYLVLITRVYISLILINLISFRDFSSLFSKIILFISPISWLSWLIITFDIVSPLPNFDPIDGRKIYNFILFGVWDGFINYDIYKNSGLWWEPGAYQVFVNLAFIFSVLNNSLNKKIYLIYLITIISIGSTSGFIVFFIISFCLFFKNLKLNIRSIITSLFLIIIFLLIIINIVIPNLLIKLSIDNVSFSALSRYYDFIISYNLFKENLLFGYGFGSQIENAIPYGEKFLGYDIYHAINPTGSDGITMLISQLGIFSFLIIFFFLFSKYFYSKGYFFGFIISLSTFILFNTENFTYSLIFTLLLFYGVRSWTLKVL